MYVCSPECSVGVKLGSTVTRSIYAKQTFNYAKSSKRSLLNRSVRHTFDVDRRSRERNFVFIPFVVSRAHSSWHGIRLFDDCFIKRFIVSEDDDGWWANKMKMLRHWILIFTCLLYHNLCTYVIWYLRCEVMHIFTNSTQTWCIHERFIEFDPVFFSSQQTMLATVPKQGGGLEGSERWLSV